MRKISELTKPEGAGLWDVIMPTNCCPFNGIAHKFGASEKAPARFCFMHGVERLGIHFDGYIWADSDLTHKIKIDEQKATAYLESIGIERFSNQLNPTSNE